MITTHEQVAALNTEDNLVLNTMVIEDETFCYLTLELNEDYLYQFIQCKFIGCDFSELELPHEFFDCDFISCRSMQMGYLCVE
jgi:hypothetical protein